MEYRDGGWDKGRIVCKIQGDVGKGKVKLKLLIYFSARDETKGL